MKSLVLAAALIGLAPAVAHAQIAAGSVPNTFERPARAAPTPAPAPAPVPIVTTPANAQAEDTLRAFISGAQTGAIDYSVMTDDLAAKVREQEAQLLPLIRSFGAVQAVDFVGSQEGADLFAVTFASAATEWVIGFQNDKVAALLFRPAQ
ncbi:MAG: hypothetical protein EON88_02085 [Brevundimonas sp.]|nr:MAG: hypothetical protein EON88_02085 [Brevundimonas sp.]